MVTGLDKRITAALEGVKDNEVKKVLFGSGDTLCALKFIREKEDVFRKLLPTYLNALFDEYDDARSAYSYVGRNKLHAYMCLELCIVNPHDVTSAANFCTAAGIKPIDLYLSAPRSTLFLPGLKKGSFKDVDVLSFIKRNPDYLLYFVPLLTSVNNGNFSSAITEYLRSAGLQDALRYKLLEGMLLASDAKALIEYTRIIDENDFYRLRAFNDVAVSLGDYEAVLSPKELVKVLRAAALGEVEKCMTADYRHAWNFINAYRRVQSPAAFDKLVVDVLERGGSRARYALLHSLTMNELNVKYAELIFTGKLTVEDISFLSYKIDGDAVCEKAAPTVFECLYNILLGMDKVGYHFKTDEDIAFARDVNKSFVVSNLAKIAARQKGGEYTARLDAIFDGLREEAQARYLQYNGDKTKLNVRAATIAFLKTDNYAAVKLYDESKITLTYDEAVRASDYLKTKKQAVKSKIIKEFLRSKDSARIAEYLLGCAEDYKKAAGEEMQKSVGKVSEEKLAKPTRRFGWESESVFEVKKPAEEFKRFAAQKISREKLKPMKLARFTEFWNKLIDFRKANADYEYDANYGEGKVTLGTMFTTIKHDYSVSHLTFDLYPLGDKFKSIFAELNGSELCFVTVLVHCLCAYNKKLYEALFGGSDAKKIYEMLDPLDRTWFSQSPFRLLNELYVPAVYELLNADELCDIIYAFTDKSVIASVKRQKDNYFYGNDLPDEFANALLDKGEDEQSIKLMLFAACTFINEGVKSGVGLPLIAKAYEKGIIADEFARYLIYTTTHSIGGALDGDHRNNVMRPGYPYKKFKECMLAFFDHALNVEFARGNLQTPYSNILAHCRKLYGAEYYVRAVAALRGLTWVRSPYDAEKNSTFSTVLKVTVRAETDSYEAFAALVREYKLTNDELIRATLFNPDFVDYTAKYLNFPWLKTAVFWFVAHLNETLYGSAKDRREQQIKEFSDIDYADFQDGAFDYKWYEEMVRTVPPAELKRIYDNAKYVTVGGLHKRAQRFFDAVNGKIEKRECLDKIRGTRNKDYCLIYSLIPVADKSDLYERYAVLAEFMRSSKQFGAQRQASERRTVDIAFENLARAAGYADSNVFVFEMEAQNPSDIYKPHDIGDIVVTPYIDGKALKIAYTATKDGKKLSSVPAKYGKDKALVELREEIKTLNKKFARVKFGLEKCMINSVTFTAEQLRAMCRERIIAAVLEKIVLLGDGALCLCKDGELVDFGGNAVSPKSVVVAHPVVLKQKGLLGDAIKYIAENNIKQPFKQALREIYTRSGEELTQDEALRFKGYNVDLKKCVAALKGKGWSVSEDIGLRRVFYKTDTVAAIFREFDCFYTIDYENVNRELHGIFFLKRKSGEIIPLKDVDEITFSETLRDVDLMITISSNTVFDFELAKSTVEIRQEILKSIVQILKLNNVEFLKDNIKVVGHYGNYVINIRTGLVFKEGKGNLLLDTVYSADKPLLLDFIDEDPMCVDIISKAVVLSDDARVTDPSILREIRD